MSESGMSNDIYVFVVLNNVVSWKAQLQHVVALSSTEAKYTALTKAVKESLWLRRFVSVLPFRKKKKRILSELGTHCIVMTTVRSNCLKTMFIMREPITLMQGYILL